jgi:hypothetical protein
MPRSLSIPAIAAFAFGLTACDTGGIRDDGPNERDEPFVAFSFSGHESGTFETSDASAVDLGARIRLVAVMQSGAAEYALEIISNRPLGTGEFEFDPHCRIIFPSLEEPPCAIGRLEIEHVDEPSRDYSFIAGTFYITAAFPTFIAGEFEGTMSSANQRELAISGGAFGVTVVRG